MRRHILVTGAAGFIGSSFIREALQKNYCITIIDSLTYAGHMENISDCLDQQNCNFIKGDISDFDFLEHLFKTHFFHGVIHFAAESHVDNSINGPKKFIETNILGTFNLLESSRKHFESIDLKMKDLNNSKFNKLDFRFLHISTDEVFGQLGLTGKFSETTPYAPNSPYSASKASSDHLVRAWHHTYGLPTLITNCSNNYGPRQYPEKLIPLMILNALTDKPLPVYGTGNNIRDWIHVQDHAKGVLLAFEKGIPGQSYCFGGNSERTNLGVVQTICSILNELSPRRDGRSHEVAIAFVQDRIGHDFRYAIDDQKAERELGFQRDFENFEEGLRQTVQWYLNNQEWVQKVLCKNKKIV